MENIYLSGEYSEKHPDYHVEDSPWKARHIFNMVSKHNLQPASICEIGCGAGEILKQLQPHFSKETLLHGYDISPQAIALSKHRENEQLHFFAQDLLAVEVSPPYDLLLCIDVFEHVEDYMGFLRIMRQKATYKIFHIPLDMSVQAVLRRQPILMRREKSGHLHYFCKETALLTLQDTGYDTIDWFYTAISIDKTMSIKAKLAKWPRKLFYSINPDLAVRIWGGYSLLVLAK